MSFISIVRGINILDYHSGNRIFAQYYPSAISDPSSGLDTLAKQKLFESNFLSSIDSVKNSARVCSYSQPDIISMDGNIIVYQLIAPDLAILVIGSSELYVNPLLLASILTTIIDALKAVIPYFLVIFIFSGSLSTKSILESFDVVCILFDELIDDGIPLELDTASLVGRLPRRKLPDGTPSDTPLAEQTITQAIQTAKYWKETLLK